MIHFSSELDNELFRPLLEKAQLYDYIVSPPGELAENVVHVLHLRYKTMLRYPKRFNHVTPNGYALYKDLLPWLYIYLQALKAHPTASINVRDIN